MNENELMGSMKVSKAVAKMAIPSVISSLEVPLHLWRWEKKMRNG